MEMSNLKNRNRSSDKEENDQTDDVPIKNNSLVSQRMTIAGGFLDIALFVANVEHLKFIVDTGREDIEYYNLLLGLLGSSLGLQLIVGALLFVVSFRKNVQTMEDEKWEKRMHHIIIGLVSMIAVTDIFITTFGDRGETIVRFRNRHSCQLRSGLSGAKNSTLF